MGRTSHPARLAAGRAGRNQDIVVNQKLITIGNLFSRFSLDALAAAWRNLEPRYKQSFGVLAAVNLAVFSYGLIHHPVGDHDLMFFNGYPPEMGWWSGRWFQGALTLLTFNTTAPVYTQLLAIFFQILAAMGMVRLWKPEAGAREMILGGLVVCLMPLVNWQHYYRSSSHFFSFPQLAMVLALLLCAGRQSRTKTLAAGLLVTISLATYNPAVQTYAVGWAGLLVLRLAGWDGTGQNLGRILKSLAPAAAAGLAGGLLYYLASLWLIHQDLMDPSIYLNATRTPAEMLAALPDVLAASFRHLRYSQLFLPGTLKSLLLLTVYLGLACLALKAWSAGAGKGRRLPATLAAVIFMLFCSKLAFVISQYTDYYAERIAQMSLPYIYLFFILIVLDPVGPHERRRGEASPLQGAARELASFFLILVVLPYMAVCDLRAQEAFVIAARHDFAVANRVMSKMESRLGGGLGGGRYAFVQLGAWKPMNDHLNSPEAQVPSHQYRTLARLNGELVFRRLSAEFEPKAYYTISSAPRSNPPPPPDVVRAARLSAGRRPFPDDDFISIHDDLVVLLFDEEARQEVLRMDAVARAKIMLMKND